MSILKTFSNNFIWSIIHQFSNQLVNFLITIFLARILFPSDFGLMALTYVLYVIGERISDAGLSQSLIRSKEVTNIDLNTVFFTNIFISLLIYLILFIIAPFIAEFYNEPTLKLLIRINSLSIILLALGSIQLTILNREMNFKNIAIFSSISAIIGGVLGVLAAYNGFGVWSLVINLLSNILCRNILLWTTSKWFPNFSFSVERFKYHIAFGYKLTLATIIDAFFNNVYPLIIGKVYSTTTTGFYARADSIKNVTVSSFFNALLRVLFPLFSSLQEHEKLNEMIKKTIGILFFTITPLLLFLGVLAEPLFRFLFTEKWLPSVPFFQIICIGAILYPLEAFNSDIMKIKGRSDVILITETLKKIIIFIALIFAIRYSIFILLYTQVALSILNFLINVYYSQKVFGIRIFSQIKIITPILLITFIAASMVYMVDYNLKNYPDLVRLITAFISGTIFYIFLSSIFKINSYTFIKNIIVNKQLKI